jgi:pyruvate/2-oxoglutarate dehydrogenase complex dihydrolipoamide dehydrogenase (E3) component
MTGNRAALILAWTGTRDRNRRGPRKVSRSRCASVVELAQVFARFGTAVTLIEPTGRLLPQDEPEAGELITKVGNDGFIKLVVDGERGVLAGATSAGPVGGEVLSMLTLAVRAAVPVQRLREMIYAYPTFRGAVPEAIGRLS